VFKPNQIFAVVNLAVLPAWALLVFAPRWRFTRLITAYAAPSAISLLYLFLVLPKFGLFTSGSGTLELVARFYQDPWLLLAAWAHYLALDLFLGAWMVRDSIRLKILHAFVVPCLFLAFVAGPIGLLAYFAVRAAVVRKWPSTSPPPVGGSMINMAQAAKPAGQPPVRPRVNPPNPRG
jgi:hypothetical protein